MSDIFSGASFGAQFGPWGALGGGIAGGLMDLFGGNSKAELQRKQTDEAVRRLQNQQAQKQGQAVAAGNASGVEATSGSLNMYLNDMAGEFRNQADWLRKAGYAGADATSLAGSMSAASDIGGSLFKFGASQNWFQNPTV